MAKQTGPIRIQGTIDGLTFYKMEGQYYVRRKSSLSSKKFFKDKAFERSHESCTRFGEGNRLASMLYQRVQKEQRTYTLFLFLKRKAIHLLKQGKDRSEVAYLLLDYLKSFGTIKNNNENKSSSPKPRHLMSLTSFIRNHCSNTYHCVTLPRLPLLVILMLNKITFNTSFLTFHLPPV
jgi:hypothetical protein